MDATIIEAPSSTKNRTGERDPEMRQVKKGDQYHFGMKLHVGVDAETGLVHSFKTTPASVHDVTQAPQLRHGGETRVWGDAGYVGVQKREEKRDLAVEWRVALKPGQRRKLKPDSLEAVEEKDKASVRAKVEHPFLKAKRLFGYAKVRYRGLAKNRERLALLLGLGNLLTARSPLGRRTRGGVVCPTPRLTSKGLKGPARRASRGAGKGRKTLLKHRQGPENRLRPVCSEFP